MKFILILLMLIGSASLHGQDLGMNIRFDVRKEFRIGKKWELEARQQVQFSPEISALENPENDFFDDLEVLPNGSAGELNDNPVEVALDWRTGTGLRGEYRIRKWLRMTASWSLLLDPNDVGQLFRTEIGYLPALPGKRWDIRARLGFQYSGEKEEDGWEFEPSLLPRAEVQFEFKPRHRLFFEPNAVGVWEESGFEIERLRFDGGLEYAVNKRQRLSLGYRYQRRLDRTENAVSHAVSVAYGWRF